MRLRAFRVQLDRLLALRDGVVDRARGEQADAEVEMAPGDVRVQLDRAVKVLDRVGPLLSQRIQVTQVVFRRGQVGIALDGRLPLLLGLRRSSEPRVDGAQTIVRGSIVGVCRQCRKIVPDRQRCVASLELDQPQGRVRPGSRPAFGNGAARSLAPCGIPAPPRPYRRELPRRFRRPRAVPIRPAQARPRGNTARCRRATRASAGCCGRQRTPIRPPPPPKPIAAWSSPLLPGEGPGVRACHSGSLLPFSPSPLLPFSCAPLLPAPPPLPRPAPRKAQYTTDTCNGRGSTLPQPSRCR